MRVSPPARRLDDSPVNRRGFLIGFGIGGGSVITCEFGCGSEGGAVFELHIGGMSLSSLAVQHWAGRGWVKGGAGFAFVTCADCGGEYEFGLGLMVVGGVELVQHRSFVLDLQGRLTDRRIDGVNFCKPTAILGFNWYCG